MVQYLNRFYEYYPNEKYTVFHFVKYLKMRLKKKKDAWLAVCGETGVGKTLFVIMSQILFGRPMDLQQNICYFPDGQEIVDKFKALNFNTLLIDEAAREMRAVNWQSKPQQEVTARAQTDRFKSNAVFLNIPNFNELTKSLRRGSVLFRAVVLYRTETYARIVIQRKDRNWRSDDVWFDKQADDKYKAIQKKYRELNNEMIVRIERSLVNTAMDFIVPNLELILPDVTEEYERLKNESREVAKNEIAKKRPDLYKKKYEWLIAKVARLLVNNELQLGQRTVTKKEIAEALGVSPPVLKRHIERSYTTEAQKPPEAETDV